MAFTPDSAGIASIFKSAAMQSALQDAGDRLASQACAAEASNRAALDASSASIAARYNRNAEAYLADTKVLTGTAIGVVRVHNLYGVYDENQNHTLESFL